MTKTRNTTFVNQELGILFKNEPFFFIRKIFLIFKHYEKILVEK